MTSPRPDRSGVRKRAAAVTATAVVAAIACGAVVPAAHAAPGDSIAPQPDAWGRHFVDAWATNTTANTTPDTNAAIGALTEMLQYWTPEATPTPEYRTDGSLIPESLGTILDPDFHAANIAESAEITQTRTDEQADAAYIYDRRNQNYSAIQGLGPYAAEFRAGTNAGTTIPDEVPADAPVQKYSDGGNANGTWADVDSTYGDIVNLVNVFRGSSASTNPSKGYYNYARPWRWSDEVLVVPALEAVKSTTPLTDGGYPSGHTNAAWLASYALAYAVPERFQELLTSASEIGHSRIVAGMHSPADVIGGRMMSTAVSAGALSNPANTEAMAAARENARELLATTPAAEDPYADAASNEQLYVERLTYGLPRTGEAGLPVVVPKGAEVLIESRLPYLTDEQRRWVLHSTGLESGYALLDDAEGWGRLNLYAAADGYSAFATDVAVDMDAADGGFSAADTWRNDIEGEGSLTKSGTGSLTLSGANSFTGGTAVEGGSLVAASATALGAGDVSVGDGVLSETAGEPVVIGGDLALEPGSALALTVDGTSPAFQVAGEGELDGTLTVAFADGVVPADDVVLATFGSLGENDQFTSVDVQGLPAGYNPAIEVRGGALHLVNSTPGPGALTPGQPSIDGIPLAGETLTVAPGQWSPAPVSFSYQWFRGEELVEGATAATYELGSADVGHLLSVAVTGAKEGYAPQSRTVAASGVVKAAVSLSETTASAGERIAVSGAGFTPGETVDVVLHSAPVTVGTAVVAASGEFSVVVTIPADTTAGTHSIVVTGRQSAVSATAALTVSAAASGALAVTGASVSPLAGLAALGLLTVGAGLLVGRRVSRTRRS
ncbi:phosphatase PAP2 family protein [Microbacterium sp. HD4P20]|uniref:acid phosphatase n=1 Tax=Microbacterium sp. HD4P20 TaxID=2864874 RepID=UPI001C640F1C|nr:phosphatase PAP2 family protein [Microbacterium sp. HD4P20]MCP2638452.1 phosphatase PAP2 family protein [Microbacterium sp. HD4P20]